jgi:LuxR family maltose regulon positive regulatory protein
MLQTLLRPGQTERVEAALAALDEHERGDPEMRATLASLRLAQHDPQAATAALAPVIDGSVGSQPFSVVAALLLEAAARDALRDPATAGRALERALDLAEPNSVLKAFLIHPAPELLERHSRQRTARAVPDRRGPGPARRDEQTRRAARGTAAPALADQPGRGPRPAVPAH